MGPYQLMDLGIHSAWCLGSGVGEEYLRSSCQGAGASGQTHLDPDIPSVRGSALIQYTLFLTLYASTGDIC